MRLYIIIVLISIFQCSCDAPTKENEERGTPSRPIQNEIISKIETDPIHADTLTIIHEIEKADSLWMYDSTASKLMLLTAINKARMIHYPLGIVKGLGTIGAMYTLQGNFDSAQHYHKLVLRYATLIPESFCYKEYSYTWLAVGLQQQGFNDSAMYYAHLAIDGLDRQIQKGMKNLKTAFHIYCTNSVIVSNLNYNALALLYHNKAQVIADQLNDPGISGNLLLTKATLFHKLGTPDSSVAIYAQIISNSEASPELKINALCNWGTNLALSQNQDTLAMALAKYKQAWTLCNTPGKEIPKLSKKVSYLLATSYQNLGMYTNNANYLKSALDIYEKLEKGPKILIDNNLSLNRNLFGLYARTKQYQKAIEQAEKALTLRDSVYKLEKLQMMNKLDVQYRVAQKDKTLAQNQLKMALQDSKLRGKNIWISTMAASTALLFILALTIYRSNKRKKKLHENLLQLLQQEQQIDQLRAVMQGEEQKRSRLARELHDGIGGMLAFILMDLSVAKSEYQQTSDTSRLDKLMLMVQDTSSEVRKAAHNLMPDALTRHNLVEALVIYCDNINKGGAPEIEVQVRGNLNKLDKSTELMLYRMAQELIQNILKHARAQHVLLQLIEEKGKIKMFVDDDGIGFDVDHAEGGYGLQNLHYRVRALHGELSITSEPSIGTTVYIEFDGNPLLKKNNINSPL